MRAIRGLRAWASGASELVLGLVGLGVLGFRVWELGVLGLLAAGCAAAQPGTAPADVGSLAEPVRVAASGAATDSRVTFTVAGGFASPRLESLAVARPQLGVHAGDGRATLDALVLPLGDIDVPATALPPHGLGLRDLVLRADPARATVIHAEADALELRASLPLALDWSMLLADGSRYRLGTVRTAPVDVDVRVFRAAGELLATVDARCDGTCWALPGIVQLSDGAIHVEADATVTAAP